MATAPLKSQPLHNFSLPFLKWGGTGTNNNHHHHRFRRPLSDHDHDSDSDNRPPRLGSRPPRTNRYAVSPSNHHSHIQNHNPSPLRNNISNHNNNEHEAEEEEEEEEKHDAAAAEAAAEAAAAEEAVQKPWNLRPRKQTALAVTGGPSRNGNGEGVEAANGEGGKSTRLRGMVAAMAGAGEGQCSSEKRKFWIALSRDEIEEDIFIMTGSRPARRPRKRPKNVQKQMDSVFPGLWLVGVSAEAYRVADAPAKASPTLLGGRVS
ncbi:hypothetical protein PIB30_005925 [Stylosanthes scabra]|uniref:Uncharacterized protein n=1 Tax=Stylosanthes scabra TaxID=79078 RepID=A0ABU6R403_9FABA|nr:hypothetical protein [Stylosanthes scabra]